MLISSPIKFIVRKLVLLSSNLQLKYTTSITLTDNHKILVNDRYLPSRDIDLYDTITVKSDITNKTYPGIVTSIHVHLVDNEEVYNLEVAGNHNYFANDVLVSNCHHTPCHTWSSIALHSNARIKLGFSATPFDDVKSPTLMDYVLIGLTGPIIGSVDSQMLFDKGYVIPPVVYFHPVKNFIKNIKYNMNWVTVYKHCIIENDYRNMMICMISKRLILANRKILIIVLRIKHGKILLKMIESMGLEVAFFHGEHTHYSSFNKGKSIEDILEHNGIVIATSGILSEGVDIPIVDAVINAQACKNRRQVIQVAGRMVRPHINKTSTCYIDFMDHTHVYLISQSKKRKKALLDKGYKSISNLFGYIKSHSNSE